MLQGLVSVAILVAATWAAGAPESSDPQPSPPAGGSDIVGGVVGGRDARPLPFFYDLYTFRGSDKSTAVIASFAVPAGRLEDEQVERQVRYRFDVTLVLADTALRTVSRTDDSVFVRFTGRLDDDHLLFTYIEVQADPSATTLQRVIMTDATTPGIGQLYDSAFPIPDYSGSQLMLSDIALGLPDAQSGWKRGDATLALLPTSQFPASAFEVYYEVYNLPSEHRYATEIFVEPIDPDTNQPIGNTEPVRLRFQGESSPRADGTLPELRRVDAQLTSGRYLLTVTVTDEVTGASANRSRYFDVRGWEGGMTMVQAMPRRQQVANGG